MLHSYKYFFVHVEHAWEKKLLIRRCTRQTYVVREWSAQKRVFSMWSVSTSLAFEHFRLRISFSSFRINSVARLHIRKEHIMIFHNSFLLLQDLHYF